VRYLALLRGFTSQPERGVTAYQTVSSFFSHLFIYEAHWNPEPLITAGWLGEGLIWLVTAILLIVSCVWVGKTVLPHRFTRDLHFAIFTILSVILSPLALDYHYPLLLLPIGVVLAWIIRSWTTGNRWSVVIFGLWAMAVFAIGADLPYRSPRLTVGIWALLAYPKLYGALLLWVIAMWAVNDDLKREHAQQ
jgi:hypothetical protein